MSNASQSDSYKIPSAPEDGAVPKLTELGVGGSATEDGLRIFTDIQVEELEWWWDGVIPKGVYCEVIGLPEAGKSTLMAEVIAHLSNGTPFPDEPEGTVTNSCYYSTEDHAGTTIKPRLENAGADMERVLCLDSIDGEPLNLSYEPHLKRLQEHIQNYHLGFIVLDPISACFGGSDAYKDHVARGMLGPLVKILQQSNCTLCAIRHTTKKIEQAIHAGGGSGGFTAQSRASYIVGYLDSSQEERVMVPLKTNLSVKPPPQGFKLIMDEDYPFPDFPAVKWTQEYPDLKAHDLTSRTDESDPQRNPKDQITDWLIGLLQQGPVPSKDIKKFLEERGYSRTTYQRARDALKEKGVIENGKNGVSHYWKLTNN